MLDSEQIDINDYLAVLRSQLSASLREAATQVAIAQKRTRERDAALARIAEIEKIQASRLERTSEKAA